MAMSFGDQLFVGGYGKMPGGLSLKPQETTAASRKKPTTAAANIDLPRALLQSMTENRVAVRQTAVFGEGCKDVPTYIEFVCGERPRRPVIKINEDEVMTMAPLNESDGSRWQPLQSRPAAPLLDSPRRLPAEFNLLHQFEKAMRDLQRNKAVSSSGWSYGSVGLHHPCFLQWEWMNLVSSGGKDQLTRCEGVFDRKSAVGCIGYVPRDPAAQAGQKLRRVAALAVASTVVGTANMANCFPTSVTVLGPGHIAFILVTAFLDTPRHGFRRFGFATNGSVTILHRCLELPPSCVDKIRWAHIARLRDALRRRDVAPRAHPRPRLRRQRARGPVGHLLGGVAGVQAGPGLRAKPRLPEIPDGDVIRRPALCRRLRQDAWGPLPEAPGDHGGVPQEADHRRGEHRPPEGIAAVDDREPRRRPANGRLRRRVQGRPDLHRIRVRRKASPPGHQDQRGRGHDDGAAQRVRRL
uniref:Uncharacterized protein n=1 Tax=Zooxanthella nutricula TaxID=1333877 RepID=A0A7S2K0Y4_9DINO|mmetsp:Transcript_40251/g.121662  ORF Transcript_40251/g.121662 Transcript_40251/m.121662 type:complete len:467 (+) Transcript_40251:639-2039(+)